MSEPFIAEIRMWACNFAPRSWALCDGQLLPVAENTALFSLVGTTYGGDGRTTFALPDLRNRAPMHPGRGPGLSSRRLGEKLGANEVTITEAQMPMHNHILNGVAEAGISAEPGANYFMGQDVESAAEVVSYTSSESTTNAQLAAQALANSGGNQPHENRQPNLGVNFCIALQGLYPSRS
ncbi:tail fiber protein [Pseudoalteromonas sp. YIC-656]|uniref:phage tail protein n=1 Tax=Pseudoalteromonas pernae TaxID=3118054 RepID=UPI003242580E